MLVWDKCFTTTVAFLVLWVHVGWALAQGTIVKDKLVDQRKNNRQSCLYWFRVCVVFQPEMSNIPLFQLSCGDLLLSSLLLKYFQVLLLLVKTSNLIAPPWLLGKCDEHFFHHFLMFIGQTINYFDLWENNQHINQRRKKVSCSTACVTVWTWAFVCSCTSTYTCLWLSVSAFRLVCVWERERVGVFMCVDVYLSEQLFQRERISASVIASAIFSPGISLSPSLSLSLSLFLIFLWYLFSLWILSSLLLQTSSLAFTHLSFLFYFSLHLLVLDINRDLTVTSIREAHTHIHTCIVHVRYTCVLKSIKASFYSPNSE